MITGAFWLALYLLVVLAPVFLMLAPPTPSGRGFLLELAIALGFVGLTQIAVQFVLIARFKSVSAPYGIDVILQYHRQIALLAVVVILAHPLLIVLDNPSRLKLLNPFGGNWASRSGWLSVLALLGIVVTSVFRQQIKLPYEPWRIIHLALGVTAIVSAQMHASLAGLYTNVAWKQAVWIVIAITMVGLVLYLRLLKPLVQRAHRWRVAEVRPERGGTTTLVLEPVGHVGLLFEPGQFAWLKLTPSPFTLEEHPFSFSSSAKRPDRLEFGIKGLGDFTRAVANLPPGTPAYLDGPHGAFSIDRYPAPGYVLIAGGVGITPILSILVTMADRRDRRPVILIYAGNQWEDVAYREQIEELKGRLNLTVEYAVPDAPGVPPGRKFVDDDLLQQALPEEARFWHVFLCGPPPMMRAGGEALERLAIPLDQVHTERFNLA
jgi:predicted ferric reductase